MMGIDKHTIEEHYKIIESNREMLQRDVDKYLKNKENSLEDRWEVWTKYSQKNNQTYIHRFPAKFKVLDDQVNDDWNNRGQLITYEDILEGVYQVAGNELFDKEMYELSDEEEKLVEAHYLFDEVKEYLMSINLGEYRYDW